MVGYVRITLRHLWNICPALWLELLNRIEGRPGYGFWTVLRYCWSDYRLALSLLRRARHIERCRQRRLAQLHRRRRARLKEGKIG